MTSQFELSNAHIFFWENYYTMRQTFFWLSIKIPFQWYIIWPIFVKKISNLKKCWRHQKSHFFWWICQKKISEHHNECLYQFSCFGHHLQYSAKIFPNCPHYSGGGAPGPWPDHFFSEKIIFFIKLNASIH